MKYQFIHRYRSEHCVTKMCHVLEIKRSTYYGWLNRVKSRRELENEDLLVEIKKINGSRQTEDYGSPRMTDELKDRGFKCSRTRVARLMKVHGIKSKSKKKFKVTTDSDHSKKIFPNLLKQDFTAKAPKRKWVSDLTYIWTLEGWLYLTIILDLFNRKIVGWSVSTRMHSKVTTIAALQHAIQREHPDEGLIFHSDRGVQYADEEFGDICKDHGIIQSMSGKGNCYDNAVAESFFKTLKTELIYKVIYASRHVAKLEIFQYIESFYNRFRRHSFLGNISPEKFLLNYLKNIKKKAA